jgi:uncharacterized protein with FMN-binding domain
MHDWERCDRYARTTHCAIGTVMAHKALGQVDTISGATLTSKAWLQCVENALIQAKGE